MSPHGEPWHGHLAREWHGHLARGFYSVHGQTGAGRPCHSRARRPCHETAIALLLNLLIFITPLSAQTAPADALGPESAPAPATPPAADIRPTEPSPRNWPFLNAEVSAVNTSAQTAYRLEVRPFLGGPTVSRDVVIPPGGQFKSLLALPAVMAHELYTVSLLRSDETLAIWDGLEIDWPPEQVDAARAAIIDPDSFRRWDGMAPQWPDESRVGVMLVLAVAAIGSIGAMWIRGNTVKLATAGTILALAAGGVWLIVSAVPAVVDLAKPSPVAGAAARPEIVLAARRHVSRWTIPFPPAPGDAPNGPQGAYYPVYRNLAQMRRDSAVFEPAAILVDLDPDEIRIFKPTGAPTSKPATIVD